MNLHKKERATHTDKFGKVNIAVPSSRPCTAPGSFYFVKNLNLIQEYWPSPFSFTRSTENSPYGIKSTTNSSMAATFCRVMLFTFKLKEACRLSRLGKSRKRIFAEETGPGGTRKFWVSNQKSFLEFYSTLGPGASFYEIIEDDTWVKGYWDVDVCKVSNPHLQNDDCSLIMNIIKQIQKGLKAENICCELDNFAILDSSTDAKLSFHIILNEVKWFKKRELLEFTKKNFFTDDVPKQEYSVCLNGLTSCVVDIKVYGRLQNFRLIFSKKYGKMKTLEVSNLDTRLCFLNDMEIIESTIVQGLPIEGFIPEVTVNPVSNFHSNNDNIKPCSKKWSKLTKIIEDRFKMAVKEYKELSSETVLILSKNRLICERINRIHKSNHTYLLLNVSTMVVVKKCHKCQSVVDSYKI